MGDTNNTTNNSSNKDQMIQSGKKVLNTVKGTGVKATEAAKAFSKKNFGKVKGSYILVGAAVLVVLVLVALVSSLGGGKEVAYPAIYVNDDGDLMLFAPNVNKEEKAIKLTSDGSTGSVVYANTSDRYVLFEKNDALYLYDSKKKDETIKIVSDVQEYDFTENDKYVVAIDEEDNLYSYSFGKDKEKLDTDVEELISYTDKYALYIKEDALYVRSLNAKKDDKEKITDELKYSASFSKDGKKVVYLNDDSDLYVYDIAKKDNKKIDSEVGSYYKNDTATKFYYEVSNDGEKEVYYYNGKEKEKVLSEIYDIEAYDVDAQILVYTEKDDKEYTLYYKKGTKDAVKVEDELESVRNVKIFDGKGLYYINGDNELKYAKINGAKIGKVLTVGEDVEGHLSLYKDGYAFVGDVSDKGEGTLYIAKNGKAKKIDDDVQDDYLKVSNDGSKVYYMKDFSSGSGDLYVTSGGKGKKIETDVYFYQYVKDNLIYILKDYSMSGRKGDLYRYTGKSKKIAEDVSSLAYTPNFFQLEK